MDPSENLLFVRVENDYLQQVLIYEQLSHWFIEEIGGLARNRQKQRPIWFLLFQYGSIKQELAERQFQVTHLGRTNKAFHFDGNAFARFFRCHHTLCTQINIKIALTPNKSKGIVRNSPTVLDEGTADSVVIRVFRGHRPYFSPDTHSIAAPAS